MKDNFSVYKWRRDFLTEAEGSTSPDLKTEFEKATGISVNKLDKEEKFIRIKKDLGKLVNEPEYEKIKAFFGKEYLRMKDHEDSEDNKFTDIYYK